MSSAPGKNKLSFGVNEVEKYLCNDVICDITAQIWQELLTHSIPDQNPHF